MEPCESEVHIRTRLLIVDDHLMFRRGVRAVLEVFSDQVEIVGEAGSAEEVVAKVQELVPDVVLLDLQLPLRPRSLGKPEWEHGIAAINQIARVSPCTRVLVLSYHEESYVLFSAMRAGAHGYITKGDSYDGKELLDAIQRIKAGDVFYGAVIAQLIREYHQSSRDPDAHSEPLTPRERQVLDLLAQRKTNAEIAEQLVISIKTVKTHVANILAKLHIESRHEVPVYMRLRGSNREIR
jgi:DNA-binding NarL/FixJ family response regulator